MAVAKYTGPTLIGDVSLDCTVSETHNATATVTDHPVESGSTITDHIRPEPLQLTITGIVSNTPIGTKKLQIVSSEIGRIRADDTVLGHAETAAKKLEEIRLSAKPVKVVTRLRTYENMAMLSLSIPRDAKTGNALNFTMQFKQIRIVTNRTTRVVTAKSSKAQKKQDTGKQPTKEQTEEKKRSILSGKVVGDDGTTAAQNLVRGTFQSLGVQ